MKLLVDNQLPAALARFLSANGVDCRHVLDLDLETASDQAIWDLARKENLVTVTKDEDFAQLARQADEHTAASSLDQAWQLPENRAIESRCRCVATDQGTTSGRASRSGVEMSQKTNKKMLETVVSPMV